MASVVGWTGRRSSPSVRGFGSWAVTAAIYSFGVLHRVPTELVPKCRVHLRRIRLVLPRRKSLHERQSDHRSRDALVNGIEDSPAPLARVGHPALDVGQVVALLLEGSFQELAEP